MTIIKIGGSVITDKEKPGVIDINRIEEISNQIKNNKEPLVVVHGAGSCGHPEAYKYKIKEGVNENNVIGVGETHCAVSKLNYIFVEKLKEKKINALSFNLINSFFSKNGRIVSFPLDSIKKMIEIGIVPVLHGDVVMDQEKGATIVSGDQIISVLAKELKASRVGLATNVPGVLSDDGSVIKEINRSNFLDFNIKGSKHQDVTGGMKGKINELLVLAESNIDSFIFHVDFLGDFLNNKDFKGTKISF